MTLMTITDASTTGDQLSNLEVLLTAQGGDVIKTSALIVASKNKDVSTLGQKAFVALLNAFGMENAYDASEFVGKHISAYDWDRISEVREMQSDALFGVARKRQAGHQNGHGKFVYVISCVDSSPPRVKIGIASSPEKRLAQLSTSSPHALKLEMTRQCVSAGDIEQSAHRHFAANRRNGEWFELDAEVAIDFVVSATRRAA